MSDLRFGWLKICVVQKNERLSMFRSLGGSHGAFQSPEGIGYSRLNTASRRPARSTSFLSAQPTSRLQTHTHMHKRHYLWSGCGIKLAQGGLSMWACVNLLAGCECIIFHNQPAACDVPRKMRLLCVCRWSGTSAVQMYSPGLFSSLPSVALRAAAIRREERLMRCLRFY